MLVSIPCRGGGESMASCKQKRSSAKRHAILGRNAKSRPDSCVMLLQAVQTDVHVLVAAAGVRVGWLASFDPVTRGETRASGPLRTPFLTQPPGVLRQRRWLPMGCVRSQPPTYFLPMLTSVTSDYALLGAETPVASNASLSSSNSSVIAGQE